ncbi:hypothetical protein KKB55_14285, partial [Myxococcota bacterium]|nr:hypothetical protein [Myxococcota bacterium]MBU1898905.1 hypothetical protein [Myxococcota bacterium]
AERRARYEARPVAPAPARLPPGFLGVLKAIDGRLSAVVYERQSRVDGAPPTQRLRLSMRAFGPDVDVAARLLAALRALKLPGLDKGIPDSPVQGNGVRWSFNIRRLVAPNGAAREQRMDLEWFTLPPQPQPQPPDCRKPPSVELPEEAPAWLARVTGARSTRHRISASVSSSPQEEAITLRMLYRNGEAHDEGVGHLIEAARGAGFALRRGEGTRQVWAHPVSGEVLAWRPDAEPLTLGCRLTGPVLHITWTRTRKAPL